MKALIVYDSMFGNTGKIAEVVGEGLKPCGLVQVLKVSEVMPEQIKEADLLVIGSPTQKFRPLPSVTAWLKSVPRGSWKGKRIAIFDTRMTEENVKKVGILRFFVSIFGYAAGAIEKQIKPTGGKLISPSVGFYIQDTEGPLVEGELERAAAWAQKLVG
jgi:flavodoxin